MVFLVYLNLTMTFLPVATLLKGRFEKHKTSKL